MVPCVCVCVCVCVCSRAPADVCVLVSTFCIKTKTNNCIIVY